MDPRSSRFTELTSGGGLAALAARSGEPLPQLMEARTRSLLARDDAAAKLAALDRQDDVSVVVMGSWGRLELTSGSDHDFVVLVGGSPRIAVSPTPEQVGEVLNKAPSRSGAFDDVAYVDHLVTRIGRRADDNDNLTRRMLLVLESMAIAGGEAHEAARRAVIETYIDTRVKDYRPPRFLLNDLQRYWRTICVDFEGKQRDRRSKDKWALRAAKLRTSRKLLFASGLLPVLECHDLTAEEMRIWLGETFAAPPVDRIADAFLRHEAYDAGVRTLVAYDRFLGHLDDEGFRDELRSLTRGEEDRSAAWVEARRLGRQIEEGLLALLFDRDALARLVRQYGVF
ncbi:MAG: hypothetical protein ACEQSX_16885 [Baekduiaceae bacterium]